MTERRCSAVDCRALLDEDEPGPYCEACLESVYAFRPNPEVDDWFFVAKGDESLSDRLGESFTGDQCGSCGVDGWTLVETPNNYAMRCSGAQYADEWVDGCGVQRRVQLMPSYKVIF